MFRRARLTVIPFGILLCLTLAAFLIAIPLSAQEPTPLPPIPNPQLPISTQSSVLSPSLSSPTPDPQPLIPSFQGQTIAYGITINGVLDDADPRVIYRFEALRGDLVRLDVRVLSGDLDPLLTLVDEAGSPILIRDDTTILDDDDAALPAGARDIRVQTLRLPASGVYTLIVARFGYGVGTTSGAYTLTLDRIGASSESGSALRYGDSVINAISDSEPQIYYSFRAQRGDIVTITMQRMSGDLDAALVVVNAAAQVIGENDDKFGSLDAEVRGLIIPDEGQYIVIATRFGGAAGRSAGSFVVTLQATGEGEIGENALAALPISANIPVTGELTPEQFTQYYTFEGRRGETVTVRMARASGDLDPYVALTDSALIELAINDDSEGTQNSLIDAFLLPADGRYYLIATRFQAEAGDTSGGYTLSLERAE